MHRNTNMHKSAKVIIKLRKTNTYYAIVHPRENLCAVSSLLLGETILVWVEKKFSMISKEPKEAQYQRMSLSIFLCQCLFTRILKQNIEDFPYSHA